MSDVTAGYARPDAPRAIELRARPENLRLDLAETALVVVDMQNAYASPGGYLDLAGFNIEGARAAINGVRRAIDLARAANIPVMFFQNGWDAAYREAGGPMSPNYHKSNALKAMRRNPNLHGKLLAKGGWDYDLVDELPVVEGDLLVPKIRYSGFRNTPTDSLLRARGIRNLVFTGIATNVCVESSIRDAFHLEYFCVLLADAAHQAGPPEAHQAAIYNIEAFFGWVSTVGDFADAIGKVA